MAAQGPALDPPGAVALARARGPFREAATARRLVVAGRARADAAWPNPIAEWRRENLSSPLQPDIFGTVQVPLDVTGRRWALRASSTAATRRASADSAAAARATDGDVLRAFWRATLASELAALARTEREARERTAAFDDQRFRAGAIAEVTLLRARVEVDRARITEAAALGDAARARGDLARWLGLPPDSLPPLAPIAPPRDSATVPDEAAALARALADRPDLVALRFAATEAARRAQAERRGIIGDLQVVSGYKQTGGFNTGLLGVMVPLPLFTRNEGARDRTQGEALLAQAELRDAEGRVRGEVHAAVAALRAMREARSGGADGLDARAADVATIAEAAYREGAISLLELLDAQRARADSRATALRWMVDLHLAVLDLNRALGAPLLETP